MDGTTALATETLFSGTASYSTSKLPLGNNPITAIYNGAGNDLGSTSATLNELIVNPDTTSLTSSPNPSKVGETVTFTATVNHTFSATPTGTVTFKEGATVLGTSSLNSNGVATFSTSTLKKGTNDVKAYYSGDSNYEASTSPKDAQVVDE